MTIYASLFVCLLGLVLYYVFGNPPGNVPSQKTSTLGLQMFWVGLLVFLLGYARVVNLLK